MSRYVKNSEDPSPLKRLVEPHIPNKRQRLEIEIDENMSDNSTDRRRANFSNIPPNGVNRNVNILTVKPTTAKKIVIKNLRSE